MDLESLFSLSRRQMPAVCVEMSGNHQGSLDGALAFVDAAHDMGADLLKFQVYRPDTITLESDQEDFRLESGNDWAEYGTLHELYQRAHTPWGWIERLFRRAKEVGLPAFASPFDPSAVSFLENLGCPMYKIASPEITDIDLIDICARTGKPVILSTGLASLEDLDLAATTVRRHGGSFMILKCVSAYPTPVEATNAATIPWLQERYGCPVGLSDHTLGVEAGFAAVALGARMIEKHFRLAADQTSMDAGFSMSLDRLPAYKKSLNNIAAAVGKPTLKIPPVARPSLSGRRSLYVVKDVPKGEFFTPDNVRSIRPSYGMHPVHLPQILGRRAARDIVRGERMTWDLVEQAE